MALSGSITGPAYRIVAPHLVIRCMEPKYATMLGEAVEESREHLLPWMPWAKSWPLSIQDRIELLRNWRGNFDLGIDYEYAIFNLDEAIFMGAAGLHTRHGKDARGIGYWIHKDHINHGYATEASAALTRVAFEIDHVSRVEIRCDPRNYRSIAIPKKLGFTCEATLHNRIDYLDGHFTDSMIWTLFDEEYGSSVAAKLELQAFDAIGRRII